MTREVRLKLLLDNAQFMQASTAAGTAGQAMGKGMAGGATDASRALKGATDAANAAARAAQTAARMRLQMAQAQADADAKATAAAYRDAEARRVAALAESANAAAKLAAAKALAAQSSGMAVLVQQERQVIPMRQAAEAAQRAIIAAHKEEADALAKSLNAQRALNAARSAAPAAARQSTPAALPSLTPGISQSAASASSAISADAAAAVRRIGLVDSAVAASSQAAAESTRKLGEASNKAAAEAAKISPAADRAALSTAGVGRSAKSISFGEVAKGAVAFGAVEAAARGALSAITAIPRQGLGFIADTEVAQLGMSGMLASMTTVAGQATTFDQAMDISAGTIRRLQKAAAETAASSAELIDTFKAISGGAMAAGMSLEQVEKFTVVGVNAVKSQGLKGVQLVQELRDLAGGGQITAASSVATMLGITDRDIAKAKNSAEGLFGFLMGKMAGFDESSKRFGGTLTGSIDALNEKVTQAGAVAMAPVADALKDAIKQISGALDDGSITGAMNGIGQGIASTVRTMSEGAAMAREYSGTIGLIAMAYAAIKVGGVASQFASVTSAKLADINASRLSVAQAALSTDAKSVEAQSSRAMLAALIAEQRTKVQGLATEAAVTAAKLRSAEATAAQLVGLARLKALEASVMPLRQQHAQQTAALTTAQNSLATATNAASTASRIMGGVVGALGGPIGIAIAAAMALTAAFMSARREAEALGKTEISVKRVEDKISRGEKVDDKDAGRVSSALDEAKEKRDEALLRTQRKYSMSDRSKGILGGASNVEEDRKALADAEANVKKFESLAARVKSNQEVTAAPGATAPAIKSDTAIKALRETTEKAGSPAQLKTAAAEKIAILDAQTKTAADLMRREGKSAQEIAKVEADSAAARKEIAADLAKSLKTKGATGLSDASQYAKAAADLQIANSAQASAARLNALDNDEAAATASHQRGLIGLEQFEAEKIRIQRARLAEKISLLDEEIKAEEARKPKAKDKAERTSIETKVVQLRTERQGAVSERDRVGVLADAGRDEREAARQKLLADEYVETWRKARDSTAQLRQQNDANTTSLLTDPAAKMRAETATQIAELRKSAAALQDSLTIKITATRGEAAGAKTGDDRAALNGQADELERQRLAAATETDRAIELANKGLTERLKPGWQSMVEGWSDSQKLMREASDQTMMSLVKGGEDAFVKFATTGKLSIKDLSQTMIADLARVEYRKFIGGEASKPGGMVGGLAAMLGAGKQAESADLVGPREQGAPVKVMTESVDALTPVLNKFKEGLAGGTGELGKFIGGLGSSLSGLFSGVGGSGGGGFGGILTSIMSLFAADGASFGTGGVRAFASGGQFTNKIVDRDTRFRYREGGREKLGLMGEAGPEAIMPLSGGGAQAISADGRKLGNLPVTRAADGRLSVVVSGAAPSASAATQQPRPARFANGGTFGALPQPMQSASRQSTQLQISAPVNVTISDNAQVQNMINQALSAQHRALSARLKQQLGVTI